MFERKPGEQHGAAKQRKRQRRYSIAANAAVMENGQPLFAAPAAHTIGDIGETIFVQTAGDQHQVQ